MPHFFRNMKKIATIGLALLMVAVLTSAGKKEKVMVKEQGTYIVNTTTLAADVMGYEGPTPLKVYIKGGKVQQIEFLPNQETPRYWKAAARHLQEKWNGKTVSEAKTLQVDGRTGATFSSDAVKENVRRALEYYEQHR